MNKRVFIGITALFFSFSSLLAQEIPSEVISAFKKGNSQELGEYMEDKVNLSLPNNLMYTDKQEAIAVLQHFFTENTVGEFTVNHQGKRDESGFVIGTLETVKGVFRINCFLRKTETTYLIHLIRIDNVNEQGKGTDRQTD